MSIPFSNRVICYCLGRGRLSLRGQKSRPWLELRRPESESTYLKHQARTLERLHPGEFLLRFDRLPGRSFYDTLALRIQSDLLWPAYDILYPRDQRAITIDVLKHAGLEGLAALWCDSGRRYKGKAEITLKRCVASDEELIHWIRGFGVWVKVDHPSDQRTVLRFAEPSAKRITRKIRPFVHPAMKPSLWPPKEAPQRFYA